jgi:prepilin-type N-terminal cleavage/methylation domain-containing protein
MKKGFTLIELLVVVLIIGILAAVALPQYEKTVWKSRATELQTLTRALGTAQSIYYMANGIGASSFDDLDLSFPLPTPFNPGMGLAYTDARMTEKYGCVLNNRGGDRGVGSGCMFVSGPYAGAGFYMLQNNVYSSSATVGELYCAGNEEFCTKIMNYKAAGKIEGRDIFSR